MRRIDAALSGVFVKCLVFFCEFCCLLHHHLSSAWNSLLVNIVCGGVWEGDGFRGYRLMGM